MNKSIQGNVLFFQTASQGSGSILSSGRSQGVLGRDEVVWFIEEQEMYVLKIVV